MNKRILSFLAVLPLLAACGPERAPQYEPAATLVRTDAYDWKRHEYFDAPWPDDRRLEQGVVPLEDFPNPGNGGAFYQVLETAEGVLKGWGTNAPIYVPLSGPIDTDSLPESPADSLADGAGVMLVVVDADSPHRGERAPVEWRFSEESTPFLPANVLAVRPMLGFPLRENTQYALVVTNGVKDSDGLALGPQESLWRALQGEGDEAGFYRPLAQVLPQLGLEAQQVAGAVIFTTQPILSEMLPLRDYLLSLPAPEPKGVTVETWRSGFDLYEGTYDAPNLQHGPPPFEYEGGEFRLDEQGRPIPARVESLRFVVCTPKGEPPAEGWPVVFNSHGTGGDYLTVRYELCPYLPQMGIAAVGIDQVLHGPRAPEGSGCLTGGPELCFFNVLNASGGRNVLRQSALDHFPLRRMIFDHTSTDLPRFDPERHAYFGHSQGGLTGAVYAALDENLPGAVLSGAAGHLATTLLVRKDPIDIKLILEGPLFLDIAGRDTLDEFHPVLALTQTLGETVDPLNYARHWVREPQGRRKSMYVTAGEIDDASPFFGAELMAVAGGLPQAKPVLFPSARFEFAGLSPVALPARGNLPATGDGVGQEAVTAVFRQFPASSPTKTVYGDHFVAYEPDVQPQWLEFLRSLTLEGSALVPESL